MSVKELTDLKVTDLLEEYKRRVRDYWYRRYKVVKAFRKRATYYSFIFHTPTIVANIPAKNNFRSLQNEGFST